MPYKYPNDIPDWLKNLPAEAQKIGIEVFNSVLADTNDEDKARQAAWGAIKNKYKKNKDGEWV
jgi:cation transport regulator ChaB